MGGRGSNSKIPTTTPTMRLQPQPQPPQQPPVNQQPPTAQNTPVTAGALTALAQMTDAQLAQLVLQSKGISMPNFLSDAQDDTQSFVFAAGLNEKPAVLDDAAFDQYLRDNGISRSQLLARSVSPVSYTNYDGTRITLTEAQVIDIMKESRLNYIGGKHGGQRSGGGTYFEMNGGHRTPYGNTTAVAALNPKTAKIITRSDLIAKAGAFARSHPQFARAAGQLDTSFSHNNMSIYALAMGYNVVHDVQQDYYNVIDRAALVYRRTNG